MIKIGNLSNKKNGKKYSFSDIHMDFQATQTSVSKTNDNVVAGNDIGVDLDERAIKNSILNILSQKRYTNPEFGINLKRYIGGTVSEMTARSIGAAIERGIGLYEPRVKIERIIVSGNADTFTYNIIIILSLLNFNKTPLTLTGVLNNSGNFNFINK